MGCSKYSTACAGYCSFESLEIEFKPVYKFAEMGKLRFVCWSFSWEQSMSSVWLNHDGSKNHNKTSRMRLFFIIFISFVVFEGKSMSEIPLKLYFHILTDWQFTIFLIHLRLFFVRLLPAIESKRRIFLRKNNETLIIACMQKFLTWIRKVNSSGFRFRFSLCCVYFSRLHNYFIHSSDLRPEKGPQHICEKM